MAYQSIIKIFDLVFFVDLVPIQIPRNDYKIRFFVFSNHPLLNPLPLFLGGQSMFNWKVYQWFIENWTSMKKDMIQATFGSEVG